MTNDLTPNQRTVLAPIPTETLMAYIQERMDGAQLQHLQQIEKSLTRAGNHLGGCDAALDQVLDGETEFITMGPIRQAEDIETVLSSIRAIVARAQNKLRQKIDDDPQRNPGLLEEKCGKEGCRIQAAHLHPLPSEEATTVAERITREVHERIDEQGDTYIPTHICKVCNQDERGHNEKAMTQPHSNHAFAPVENVSRVRFPAPSITD